MDDIARREFLSLSAGVIAWSMVGEASAGPGPSTIMIIRHGEDIGEKDFNLSPKGRQRAEALPKLFAGRLPAPQVIIASRASKGSNRPVETVEPLSRQLHLQIDTRFRDDDFAQLADALLTDERYSGKVVLVCWHHGKIPNLAKALGVKGAPRWPDDQFDHVWIIQAARKRPRLEDVPQQLLPGDR